MSKTTSSRPEIHGVLENATLRYAQVWEDYDLLFKGLALEPSDHVLSIASAGDNALALLSEGVESVTAIDLNPAQVALCELKKSGIEHLSRAEFQALCGSPSELSSNSMYESLRSRLSLRCRAYWDDHRNIIERGILHSGRLERFWNEMRRFVFEPHIPSTALQAIVEAENITEQKEIFDTHFCSPGFQKAFREFTDKENVAAHGRDIAQYKYVDHQNIGGFFYDRFRHVCRMLPLENNFYIHYLFFGSYVSEEQGPYFLRPSVFETLKGRIERFKVVQGSLDSWVAKGSKTYTKMNLSDVFEYLSEGETDAFLYRLLEHLPPGGRIAFWNHLNERGLGTNAERSGQLLTGLSEGLSHDDRTFFYSKFKVLESL